MPPGNVSPGEFRRAWSRFATGVTIVTTLEDDGRVHGMTANGVASISLNPPLAMVAVGHERTSHGLITSRNRFGISILSEGQAELARHFTLPFAERPQNRQIETHALGRSLVLDGALAMMDCRVVAVHPAGDHTIFVAEVEALETGHGKPLIWFGGDFGRLRDATPANSRDEDR